MSAELDIVIRRSLSAFGRDVESSRWRGRENEAISLYVFRHLLPCLAPGTALRDPAQIAIEAAVPQHLGPNTKAQVRKDLVLWPEPAMTCWDESYQPTLTPMAVLEWKVRRSTPAATDILWLQESARRWNSFTGYAVTLDLEPRPFLLNCCRVTRDGTESEWLRL